MQRTNEVLFNGRLLFAILVLATELLLTAMCVWLLISLVRIAKNGQCFITENNSAILYFEIVAIAIIGLVAAIVFVLQLRKLGEKRRGEDN